MDWWSSGESNPGVLQGSYAFYVRIQLGLKVTGKFLHISAILLPACKCGIGKVLSQYRIGPAPGSWCSSALRRPYPHAPNWLVGERTSLTRRKQAQEQRDRKPRPPRLQSQRQCWLRLWVFTVTVVEYRHASRHKLARSKPVYPIFSCPTTARLVGIEPTPRVLEALVLPLHQRHIHRRYTAAVPVGFREPA